MTLAEISSWINRRLRFKVHQDQYPLLIDAVQKLAFSEDLACFKVFASLTTYQTLTFDSSGYTSAVAGDVGKTVVGGSSGATGTLISYDNDAYEWVISTSDTFTDAEAITITTGTGAGNLTSPSAQAGYTGPYSYPTTIPVRKMIGVTSITDGMIYGTETNPDLNDYASVISLDDYDPRKFYQPGRVDEIAKTFTFSSGPSVDTTMRWVYFRNPETIDSISEDDAKMLIPSEHHFSVVQAACDIAEAMFSGKPFDRANVLQHFKPWWDALLRVYTPMGKGSNRTLRSKETFAGGWV